MRRELPLQCVPGPQPLAAHYQFWLSHLKGHLILSIFPHFLSTFFFLTNMTTLNTQRGENKHECFRVHNAVVLCKHQRTSTPSAMTYLCHNISICHIKMISIQFTEMTEVQITGKLEITCWFFSPGTPRLCSSLLLYQWGSNLFSVRAVRLKWRISWWRGSGFVSFSSSSSPSSCSIAFWDVQ